LHDAEYDDFWSKSALWVSLSWLWIFFDFLLRVVPSTLLSLVGLRNNSCQSSDNESDEQEKTE
jgi:hypothetical protein